MLFIEKSSLTRHSLTLVSVLLLVASLAHAGGEGAGFNGPTLSPVSIPVRLDRGVTDEEAKNAVKVCFGTGDVKKGIKSVMQKLTESIFPGLDQQSFTPYAEVYSAFNSEYFLSIDAAYYGKLNSRMTQKEVVLYGSQDPYSYRIGSENCSNNATFCLTFNSNGAPLAIENEHTDYIDVHDVMRGNVAIESTSPLPALAYDREVDDSDYDQWGNIAHRRTLLQGLHIKIQPESQSRVNFINSDTRRPVALEINTRQYVQCLQSQLQLGASN